MNPREKPLSGGFRRFRSNKWLFVGVERVRSSCVHPEDDLARPQVEMRVRGRIRAYR